MWWMSSTSMSWVLSSCLSEDQARSAMGLMASTFLRMAAICPAAFRPVLSSSLSGSRMLWSCSEPTRTMKNSSRLEK